MVCSDPRCRCSTVNLVKIPSDEAADSKPSARRFTSLWMSIDSGEIIEPSETKNGGKPASRPKADAPQVNIGDPQKLREWFMKQKRLWIYQTDLSVVDISDLPPEPPETMVAFTDIFPLGSDFEFVFDGSQWIVFDQHCVAPRCECASCIISFIRLGRAPDSTALEAVETVNCDYNTVRKVAVSDADGNPVTDRALGLLAAAKAAKPEFDELIELRRLMLQGIYHRRYFETSRATLGALRAGRGTSAKVGRNDPCPCGSGLKYKRCCEGK